MRLYHFGGRHPWRPCSCPLPHPRSTINGYLFCNGATNLTFKQGEPARWHMASLGSETDV